MRATGIVRRIDDLGRIVIPREIRKSLGIAEGDPLELFVDPTNDMVCFQKYNVTMKSVLVRAIQEVENCECFDKANHLRAVLKRNGYEVN